MSKWSTKKCSGMSQTQSSHHFGKYSVKWMCKAVTAWDQCAQYPIRKSSTGDALNAVQGCLLRNAAWLTHYRLDRLGDMVLNRLVVAISMFKYLLSKVQDLGLETIDAWFKGIVSLFQLPLPLQHDIVLLLGFSATFGSGDAISLATELCLLCAPRIVCTRWLGPAPFPSRLKIFQAVWRCFVSLPCYNGEFPLWLEVPFEEL